MDNLYCGDNLEIMRGMESGVRPHLQTLHSILAKIGVRSTTSGRTLLKGYLKFMEPRLIEMHRLLKDTGSIYLHCDPHKASHYLKVMMVGIFGMKHFRRLYGVPTTLATGMIFHEHAIVLHIFKRRQLNFRCP